MQARWHGSGAVTFMEAPGHRPSAPVTGAFAGDELEPFEWSSAQVGAYEAAVEAINGAVGAYSAVIAAEQDKAQPDQAVIDGARAAQYRLSKEHEGLRSTDDRRIAEVRSRCARIAREVLAGLG